MSKTSIRTSFIFGSEPTKSKEKDYSYLDVGLVSLVEDWRAWGVIGVTGAPFQC